MKCSTIDLCKNIVFKSIIFFISLLLLISCSTTKQLNTINIIPDGFSKYKDNNQALFQLVQTTGTNESIIKREAQLTAMSLIISRIESKVKSISEFRQNNSQTDFINVTRLLSEFKILKIELEESKVVYDNKLNKIIFWGVFKVDRKQIKSLLDKNESLNLKFEDLIQ
tara:strand:+ start:147 stop:650 length:504 start_codon:yes stop_codon:yes gene_type:complete